MFPPWAPFFFVLAAGGITAAPNKFGSATRAIHHVAAGHRPASDPCFPTSSNGQTPRHVRAELSTLSCPPTGDRVGARLLLPSDHDVTLASPTASPRRGSNLRRSGGHRPGRQSPRTPHRNVGWRYFRSAQQRQPRRSHRDRRERPRDRRKLEAQRHVPRPPDAQQHLKRLPPLPPQARSRSDLRGWRRRLPQAGRREPVRRRHLPPGQRSRFERHAASRARSRDLARKGAARSASRHARGASAEPVREYPPTATPMVEGVSFPAGDARVTCASVVQECHMKTRVQPFSGSGSDHCFRDTTLLSLLREGGRDGEEHEKDGDGHGSIREEPRQGATRLALIGLPRTSARGVALVGRCGGWLSRRCWRQASLLR